MKGLSIFVRKDADKINNCLQDIKPLIEDGKSDIFICSDKDAGIDTEYKHDIIGYSGKDKDFNNFCLSLCDSDMAMIIEKGMELTIDVSNEIKGILKNVGCSILCTIKRYINSKKTEYYMDEKTIVSSKTSEDTVKLKAVIEDTSLINPDIDSIGYNLSSIADSGKYDELFLWYQNFVSNKSRKFKLKFFENLEKYKSTADCNTDTILENKFKNINFANYSKYLTVKKLYRERLEGYKDKIIDILNSAELEDDETYFGYFLMDILRSGEIATEIIQAMGAELLADCFKYLLEYENNFYLYIYNYMISIDLKKEISRKNNIHIADYINIIKIYIGFMSDKSYDIEKKQKLVQMFIDYTNYGFYLLNNAARKGKVLPPDNETLFLIDVDKSISMLNNGKTEEGISLLKAASVKYPLMARAVEYYIQRIRLENKKYPYRLSICMIAKDEQKYLGGCLSSIKPLLDSKTAELIFVDTGSKDKTIEIAKKYTDKIYIHPWQNSFSEARNYSISLANGEYILILDADEELEKDSIKKLIELFNGDGYNQYSTYTFKEKNFSDKEHKIFSMLVRKAIFKNDGSFYYAGSVHNQPVSKLPLKNLDVTLLHYGYIMTPDIKDKKFKRTSSLLKRELKGNPQNIYYRFQLSVSYSMHGDNKEALEQVEIYLKLLENADKKDINLMYYSNAALVYFNNSLHGRAIEICDYVLELQPDFIDCIYFKAKALFIKENYDECIKVSRQYLNLLDEFSSHSISNDDRYLFYSLGSKNDIFNTCMMSYFLMKNYRECVNMAGSFDDEALKINLREIVESCLQLQRYDYLVSLYGNRIRKGSQNKIRDAFKYYLEQGLFKCPEEEQRKCTIAFAKSDIDDDYIDLFRVRAGGGIKQDPHRMLHFIDKYDIGEADYITGNMIIESTLPMLNEYKASDEWDIIELKNLKRAAGFILNRSLNLKEYLKLDRQQLLSILDKYINICAYMIKIGRRDLLEQKEISFVGSILDAFNRLQKNDLVGCLKLIKDGVTQYKEMAKPMELFLGKIVPGYKADVEDYEKEKAGYELNQYGKKIKSRIKGFIENGDVDNASVLINEYEMIIKDDAEICSFKAVIAIMGNNFKQAEQILMSGLESHKNDFDLNYNLAYAYDKLGNFKGALEHYRIALSNCKGDDIKSEIAAEIQNIEKGHKDLLKPEKKKIVFFSKGDDSFIWDIINELSREYETRKITVTNLKQIDEGMEWADICWFEWCDELVIYASKLSIARDKKIICRLHSYEAFTTYPQNVNWNYVDKIIFVSDGIRNYVTEKFNLDRDKTLVIPNGIDIDKYTFNKRKPGFNIAYVGYINYKKGPMLLLHTFKAVYDKDRRYKLYIAGKFQDERYILYFKQMAKEFGIENNVFYQGWQDDINAWLDDKDYILCTSVLESQNISVMQGMCKGIKPVIHNFVGAKKIYEERYIWNTIDEAVEMIVSNRYDSNEYRRFIIDNYSLVKQLTNIRKLFDADDYGFDAGDDSKSVYNFTYEDKEIKFYLPYLKDWIQNIIYITRNFYETAMLEDIRKRIGQNKVFIDVGANIGNHTVYFSKVCDAKKVYSFEPQKIAFDILKRNVRINNIQHIVELFNLGVGKANDRAQMIILDNNNLGMSKVKKTPYGNIEINSLDNLLYRKNDNIDLIKVDVEGMELEVLEGAEKIIKKCNPLIYVEANSIEEFDKINAYLKNFGYKAIYRFNATTTYLFAPNLQ
ncbi:MAG: FkbM family methyltransferase [Clostridiales bacterium]|nr:FkbM family methyltransferase [Clostridiales bacterium]